MGIFRHFPYTNFHEMNLDWLLKEVKRIAEEWINYNTTWADWREEQDVKYNELKTFVLDYFDNLDVESEVIRLFNQLEEDGYFEAIIEELAIRKENINCELVGSGFINYDNRPGSMNGGCYIGDNKIAVYYSYDTVDLGILEIRNATTFEKLKEVELELKHGNSLTYVPDEKKIYSCACFYGDDTTTLIPNIDIVDVSDINNIRIVETKTPPLPAYSVGIYSLAYDIITESFYGICARGTTQGEYNRLIKYNKELTEIVGEQILYDARPVSSQGVQVVYNDRAYLLYYTPTFRSVYSFDVKTGKLLNVYSLPNLVNGYRFIGEVQNVIYNYDTQDWFVGSRYTGSGVSRHIGWSIIQCGFYKSLPSITIAKNSVNEALGNRPTITVVQGGDFVPTDINRFPCIMDAINASKTAGIVPTIVLDNSNPNLGTFEIVDFTGAIIGTASNHINVVGEITLSNSDVRFMYCDFNSVIATHPVVAGTGSLAVYHSTVSLAGCTTASVVLISESIMFGLQTQNNKVNAVRSIITGNTPTLPAGNTLTACVYLPYTTV